MLNLLLFMSLENLMFGLMGVGLKIRFLLFLPLVLGFLLVISGRFWAERSWGHIDNDVPAVTEQLLLVVGIVLFLAPCSLFRGLSYGASSLLCRPLVVRIWVWIMLNVVRHVGRLLDGSLACSAL